MKKREPIYFLREFDPDDIHFNPFEVQSALVTAMQRLKATRPTAAVYTSALVAEIITQNLLVFRKIGEKEPPLDQAGELGSWMEYQAMRGFQPYAAFAHPTDQPDPNAMPWSEREWFGRFTSGARPL